MMNDEIKEMIPTHKVSFYGVRCYYNVETEEICGTNWLCDLLITPAAWLHNTIVALNEVMFPDYEDDGGFPLKMIEAYIDMDEDDWEEE